MWKGKRSSLTNRTYYSKRRGSKFGNDSYVILVFQSPSRRDIREFSYPVDVVEVENWSNLWDVLFMEIRDFNVCDEVYVVNLTKTLNSLEMEPKKAYQVIGVSFEEENTSRSRNIYEQLDISFSSPYQSFRESVNAIRKGNRIIFERYLHNLGSLVNHQVEISENTLLHHAVLYNRKSMVRIILDSSKLDFSRKNIFGQTAAYLAKSLGNLECLMMIEEKMKSTHELSQPHQRDIDFSGVSRLYCNQRRSCATHFFSVIDFFSRDDSNPIIKKETIDKREGFSMVLTRFENLSGTPSTLERIKFEENSFTKDRLLGIRNEFENILRRRIPSIYLDNEQPRPSIKLPDFIGIDVEDFSVSFVHKNDFSQLSEMIESVYIRFNQLHQIFSIFTILEWSKVIFNQQSDLSNNLFRPFTQIIDWRRSDGVTPEMFQKHVEMRFICDPSRTISDTSLKMNKKLKETLEIVLPELFSRKRGGMLVKKRNMTKKQEEVRVKRNEILSELSRIAWESLVEQKTKSFGSEMDPYIHTASDVLDFIIELQVNRFDFSECNSLFDSSSFISEAIPSLSIPSLNFKVREIFLKEMDILLRSRTQRGRTSVKRKREVEFVLEETISKRDQCLYQFMFNGEIETILSPKNENLGYNLNRLKEDQIFIRKNLEKFSPSLHSLNVLDMFFVNNIIQGWDQDPNTDEVYEFLLSFFEIAVEFQDPQLWISIVKILKLLSHVKNFEKRFIIEKEVTFLPMLKTFFQSHHEDSFLLKSEDGTLSFCRFLCNLLGTRNGISLLLQENPYFELIKKLIRLNLIRKSPDVVNFSILHMIVTVVEFVCESSINFLPGPKREGLVIEISKQCFDFMSQIIIGVCVDNDRPENSREWEVYRKFVERILVCFYFFMKFNHRLKRTVVIHSRKKILPMIQNLERLYFQEKNIIAGDGKHSIKRIREIIVSLYAMFSSIKNWKELRRRIFFGEGKFMEDPFIGHHDVDTKKTPSTSTTKNEKWMGEEYEKLGDESFKKNECEKAVIYYTKALLINKYSNLGFIRRGSAFQYLNMHEEAIRDFNVYIYIFKNHKIMPTDIVYHYRGISFMLLSNFEKAIEDFTSLIHSTGRQSKTKKEKILQQLLQNEESGSSIYTCYLFRGICNHSIGGKEKIDKAISDYIESTKIDRKKVYGYTLLSMIYESIGNVDNAVSILSHGIVNTNGSTYLYKQRGGVYERNGFGRKAARDYGRVLKQKANSFLELKRRGLLYFHQEKYSNCVEDLERAMKIVSAVQIPDVHLMNIFQALGYSYFELSKYSECVEHLTKFVHVMEVEPEARRKNLNFYALVLEKRANALSELSRYEEAELDYKQSLEIVPLPEYMFHPRIYDLDFDMAVLKMVKGYQKDDELEFKKLLDRNPYNVTVYLRRLISRMRYEDIEGALEDYSLICQLATEENINRIYYCLLRRNEHGAKVSEEYRSLMDVDTLTRIFKKLQDGKFLVHDGVRGFVYPSSKFLNEKPLLTDFMSEDEYLDHFKRFKKQSEEKKKIPPRFEEDGRIDEWLEMKEVRRLRDFIKRKENVFENLEIFKCLGKGTMAAAYQCAFKQEGFSTVHQMSSQDRKNSTIGLFVIKFGKLEKCEYEKKGEEKRGFERDALLLPYHRNVVQVLHSKYDEEIDIKNLPDYSYWKEKQEFIYDLESVGEDAGSEALIKMKRGLVLMKFYKNDLNWYVSERVSDKFADIEICRMILGILKGAFHLHNHGIVHRDLHPGNIFVDPLYGRIWIGDFGCSIDVKSLKGSKPNNEFQVKKTELKRVWYGTDFTNYSVGADHGFYPPEVLIHFEEDCEEEFVNYTKADLYSCGILGYYIVSRKNPSENSPFEISKLNDTPQYHKKGGVEKVVISLEDCDKKIFRVIESMLTQDVNNRISFQESIKEFQHLHGIFSSHISEKNILKKEEEEEEEIEGGGEVDEESKVKKRNKLKAYNDFQKIKEEVIKKRLEKRRALKEQKRLIKRDKILRKIKYQRQKGFHEKANRLEQKLFGSKKKKGLSTSKPEKVETETSSSKVVVEKKELQEEIKAETKSIILKLRMNEGVFEKSFKQDEVLENVMDWARSLTQSTNSGENTTND